MRRASFLFLSPLLFCVCALAQSDIRYPIHDLTREAYGAYLKDPDRALVLTQKALDSALLTKDTYTEGYCFFLLSKIFWVKANYKLSTEYGFKALRVFENTPYHRELSECLLSLARTLIELGNFQKSHEFIHRALAVGLLHDDTNIEANAYREHSFFSMELNELDSALYYSDKGIALFDKSTDSIDISVLYGRKARIYHQQGEYEKSRDLAYQALLIDSLVDNRRGLGISYYQVAQNEYALGNSKKAIAQLKHSIRISSGIGNLSWQIRAHELLADYYLENNMPSFAATELQVASRFKDELYNSEKSGQIQEMQSLHELEAKEGKIRLLEQENVLKQKEVSNQRLFLAFLLVAILFLVLLIFVLTRLRTIQNKTNQSLTDQNIAIEKQKNAIEVQAENLQQLDQLKTKLFSVISHDLRGPIANLQSLLELFTKKLMTAEEFVTLSEKLKENLNVTQRTLENLLTWSLSQMGGIKTEMTKIDITSSVEEACRLMDEVASRKNVVLVRQISEPLDVWADGNQLQVVLRNLIHNAVKFSGFNEKIVIGACRENKHCEITIKDSGIGMTSSEIDTVTGSNGYFSKNGTEQEKGTGLGLLLCKEFILRNGGDMRIKSTVGEGTEVSFTLMLAEFKTSPQPVVSR